MKRKKRRFNQSYKNGTFIERCGQLVITKWRWLLEEVGMYRSAKTLVPYMFCDDAEAQEIEDYAHSSTFLAFTAMMLVRVSIVG